jgi:hypothetical protein
MCVHLTLSNKFTIKNRALWMERHQFVEQSSWIGGKVLRKGSRMLSRLLRYGLNLTSETFLRLKHLSHTHSAQISCKRQRIFFRYLCQNPEIIRGCLKQYCRSGSAFLCGSPSSGSVLGMQIRIWIQERFLEPFKYSVLEPEPELFCLSGTRPGF